MNSNPTRTIQATWLTMLTLQTVGTVDLKHKLPPPKSFVAISVLWGILFLLADTGFGKLAARLSLLVLLTATVLGPFGKRFIKFLETVSGPRFAVPPPADTPNYSTAPAPATPGMGISPINPRARIA